MKNKILAVFLSIMMIFTFSVPAYALDTNTTVQEETSYIQKMLDKLEQILNLMNKKGSITVECIDTEKNVISSNTYEKLKFGTYTYVAPELEGYSLLKTEETEKRVTINSKNKNQKIQFIYEKNNIDYNENPNITQVSQDAVELDLKKYNIYNDNSHATETSQGLKAAFKDYSAAGIQKIYLPKGTYLISSDDILLLDATMSNLDIDLNGSTLRLEPNDKIAGKLIDFNNGCKNVKLHNGTIKGDRVEHDYTTNKSSHEWNTSVLFNECNNITLDNLYIVDSPGFNLSSSRGKNVANNSTYVSKHNLEFGNYNDSGEKVENSSTIRTINPIDVSSCKGRWELGYHLGYGGYKFIGTHEYNIYFYDADKNYIGKMEDCLQFIKYDFPENTKYVNVVFEQNYLPYSGDTDFGGACVFFTNFYGPENITISNCTFDRNRSLSMAICGGSKWNIKNNKFLHSEKIATTAPNYHVDLEDGWEYCNTINFENNYFDGNRNNLVSCAGIGFKFTGNTFGSTVYFWPRTQSYTFENNTITNETTGTPMCHFGFSDNLTKISNNTIINRSISMEKRYSSTPNINLDNNTFIDSNVNGIPSGCAVTNSLFKTQSESGSNGKLRICGTFKNCTFDRTGGFADSILENCKINNVGTTTYGKSCIFRKCDIDNFSAYTGQKTKVVFEECDLNSFGFAVSTWGGAVDIQFLNNNITNTDDKKLIDLSLGKSENILIKGNTLNFPNTKNIINIYDVGYSTPAANITVEDNNITSMLDGGYLLGGANPSSGTTKITMRNNKIPENGKEVLEKYKENKVIEFSN